MAYENPDDYNEQFMRLVVDLEVKPEGLRK